MDNIDKVGGEGYKEYTKPQPEEKLDKTKELPAEMLENILSYLGGRDKQSAVLLSKSWNIASIKAVINIEFSLIKKFAEFCGKKLDKNLYGSQIEKLSVVVSNSKILGSVNLIKVKLSVLELRKKILNILKDVNKNDLKDLAELSKGERKPILFENIFNLAIVYKKIDEANKITDNSIRRKTLLDISKALAKSGNFDEAIKVANSLDDRFKGHALLYISKALIKNGDIDKAIKVANSIPVDKIKGSALLYISEALKKSGDIDKAIEVANSIPVDSDRGTYFFGITLELIENGNFDKAIEVANLIPVDIDRGIILREIVKALIKNGDIDKAKKVANLIPVDKIKGNALRDINKAKRKLGQKRGQ